MMYLFNRDEELIHIVRNNAMKYCYQTQTLTTEHYVSDRLEVSCRLIDEAILSEVQYVAVPDMGHQYRYHLFYVAKLSIENNGVSIIGVQSGIEELRKTIVKDKRPNGRSVRDIGTMLLENTNWTLGYVADTGMITTSFYYQSVFDCLKKLCSVGQVELQFFVEINRNKIGNRYIELKKRIGKATGERVVYGTNALSIVKETDNTGLVTALIGRGRGEEVSSAEENESGQAGYGRKITFEDVEWQKSAGKPVDKPLGQLYVEIPERTGLFGIATPSGMRPRMGVIEFDTDDRDVLLEKTYEALETMSRPQAMFKTSSVYLEAEIGDTVRVVRHDLHLDYEVRVFEVKWDRLLERSVDTKLGDQLVVSESQRQSKLASDIINELTDELDNRLDLLVDNLPSADGFNTNWYGEGEPQNPRVNDIWYKPDPEHEGHYILMLWNGEMWEEIVRTYDSGAEARAKIDEMESQLSEFDEKVNTFIEETDEKLGGRLDTLSEDVTFVSELIGSDGKPRYNKNRIQGKTDKVIPYGVPSIRLYHNGEGFVSGKVYTISFDAECVIVVRHQLIVQVSGKQGPYTVTITDASDEPLNPTRSVETEDGVAIFDNVQEGTYHVVATAWRYEPVIEHNVVINQDVVLDMTMRTEKTIADGNESPYYIGRYASVPDYIFDGGK